MTTIVLGTRLSVQDVYRIAMSAGFNDDREPRHIQIPGLRLQIHLPQWLHPTENVGGIERVVDTEIELDDFLNRIPDNAEAMGVLRRLYEQMPDLICLKPYLSERPPVMPVSEYIH